MKIQPVNSFRSQLRNNSVEITGYSAALSTSLCVLSANFRKNKYHKTFAWLSVLSMIAHIATIEYFKHKK